MVLAKQLVHSSPLPSTGQNQHYGNILIYETSVISIMVSHFDYEHRLPQSWLTQVHLGS